jgi:hypothetical protein
MEILRVPPYPITTTWELPIANAMYNLYVEDLVDHSIETSVVYSDANGKVEYILPLTKVQFDRQFLIRFYDEDTEHVLYESNLDIIRPYTNPADLATSGTASEIAEYKKWELIARSLIDTYTGIGFYNHKSILQVNGSGADYLPVWRDANRVLKVYENDVLVFDIDAADPATNAYVYKVTLDNSAIYRVETDSVNRTSSAPITLPGFPGEGDLPWINGDMRGAFPSNYNYLFVLDEGYRAIPPDIQYATEMLIDDLKCGKLDYYQRYVTSYNTDQFRIQFDKKILDGTGNVIVDKILDKYMKSITKVGVL